MSEPLESMELPEMELPDPDAQETLPKPSDKWQSLMDSLLSSARISDMDKEAIERKISQAIINLSNTLNAMQGSTCDDRALGNITKYELLAVELMCGQDGLSGEDIDRINDISTRLYDRWRVYTPHTKVTKDLYQQADNLTPVL